MPAEANDSSGPTSVLPRAEVGQEIAEAAAARADAPGYPTEEIVRIRRAAVRLGATEAPIADLRHAALLLERQAVLDLEVPTASRVVGVSLLKQGLKKLMIWYVRFLGHQISAFGQATARFGLSVANRVEGVEVEVAELRERVERLENASPPPPGSARGRE